MPHFSKASPLSASETDTSLLLLLLFWSAIYQTPIIHNWHKCFPKCRSLTWDSPGCGSEGLEIESEKLRFFPGDLTGTLYTGKNRCPKSSCPPCFISLHSLLGQLHAWYFLPATSYIFMNHKYLSPDQNHLLVSGSTLSTFCYISPFRCPGGIVIPHHTDTQAHTLTLHTTHYTDTRTFVHNSHFLSQMLAVIYTLFLHSQTWKQF